MMIFFVHSKKRADSFSKTYKKMECEKGRRQLEEEEEEESVNTSDLDSEQQEKQRIVHIRVDDVCDFLTNTGAPLDQPRLVIRAFADWFHINARTFTSCEKISIRFNENVWVAFYPYSMGSYFMKTVWEPAYEDKLKIIFEWWLKPFKFPRMDIHIWRKIAQFIPELFNQQEKQYFISFGGANMQYIYLND